ncbi:RNA polymerase sigma factor [Dyadobacter pollutisoli]|uniref:RNA polymerase sigma factor n=1 Tax=Dyadobacter pollutisoli TaxID=2910158 RepID=A0A9E8NF24_9BACT|nr:RNA polymerase sigma factor [Dyadobacter pollutisoli]WAC14113.1 RNA polymerase sigma factor [Dyadobacter pollutisoli]
MEWLSDCTAVEQTWIEKCAKRDPKAQEFIFKHFFGFAMGITLRYLTNTDLAQEVVNDSFLKIFNQLPKQVKDIKSFRGWMRKLIVNTAIDHFRKEKRYFFFANLDDASPYLSTQNDQGDLQSIDDIILLMNQLPPLWKVVFNLNEVEGYSHEEIGAMLKIPASSSRTYLTRAKQRLRELINSQNRIIK